MMTWTLSDIPKLTKVPVTERQKHLWLHIANRELDTGKQPEDVVRYADSMAKEFIERFGMI